MANDLGMFGQDPAMLQMAIEQQARQGDMAAAQMAPGRAIVAGGAQVGRQLGGALSGMLGYQDPRIKEANTIKQIQQESIEEARALGINPNKDIEKFGEIVSNKYLQNNMSDKAYNVQQLVQNFKEKQADIGLKQAKAQAELHKAQQESDPALHLVQTGKITPAQYAQYKRGEISMDDLTLVEKQGGASGAMQERMIEQVIQNRMPNANEQEKAAVRAQMYSQMLSQPKTGFDPVTMQPYSLPGISLPKELAGAAQQQPRAVQQAGRKPLETKDLDTFVQQTTAVDQLTGLLDIFKDKYAGFGSKTAGDVAITLGQRGVDKWKDTADWWGNYQRWLTDIMKGTFGASLTKNEKTQIEQFTAHPGMAKDVLQKNLQNQISVIQNSISKRATALANAGFNQNQMDSILNPTKTTDEQGNALAPVDIVTEVMNSNKSQQQKLKILTDLKNAGFK